MGAITTVLTFAGSMAAGAGACLVTEGAVMSVGHQLVTTKVGRVCVDIAAITLGSAAFDYTSDKFVDTVIEFIEAKDKLVKMFTKSKEETETNEGPREDQEKVNGGE